MSLEKIAKYHTNGTGRDTYIDCSNGGFAKNHTMSHGGYEIGLIKTIIQLNRIAFSSAQLPQISPKFQQYQSNGSGRDSYIFDDHGGLANVPSFSKKQSNFLGSLRTYESTEHLLRTNDFLRRSQQRKPRKEQERQKKNDEVVQKVTSRLILPLIPLQNLPHLNENTNPLRNTELKYNYATIINQIMSDLHKQVLKNQLAGKHPIQKQQIEEKDEDEGEEEVSEQFVQQDQFAIKLAPSSHHGPVKAVHSIEKVDQQQQFHGPPKKKLHDYSPAKWDEFFDEMEFLSNGTSVYIAGKQNSPIFLCLHGAGHSAMSFALLAQEVKQFGMLIAFDFRGHGQSTLDQENPTLSAEQLIQDTMEVVQFLTLKFTEQTIILVGHSMGGAIAVKSCEALLLSNLAEKIQGLIVIDVVEGSAIEALPFMETILNGRPQSFRSYEQAIQWSLNTSQLKNLASARVSIPPQLMEVCDEKGVVTKCIWRVDLKKTEHFWMGWFKGLTSSFLNIRIPKILVLAEKERMDKDLTIAQMQGKFRLVVLYNTGHSVMEDDPMNMALELHDFLCKFRVPTTIKEVALVKSKGIGCFHPNVKAYMKKNN